MRLLIASLSVLLFLFFAMEASAKIVFDSTREGVDGIYVMDDDGGNVKLLTDMLHPAIPRWSPDGKYIVFSRQTDKRNKRSRLFLIKADGTSIRQLTTLVGEATDSPGPFSPDGKSILFHRTERVNNKARHSLLVIDIESGQITKLIEDIVVTMPDWSPDGKHIVFSTSSAAGGAGGTLYIIGADGSNLRPLIPAQPEPLPGALVIHRWYPRWSPNGKRIVYIQTEYTWEPWPPHELALIRRAYRYRVCNAKGEHVQSLLIPKDWDLRGIDWMENGESVVFSGNKVKLNAPPDIEEPPTNIYKYHLATGKTTRLTEHLGIDHTLDWVSDSARAVSPAGKRPMQWGALRSFIPAYRVVFKAVSVSIKNLME